MCVALEPFLWTRTARDSIRIFVTARDKRLDDGLTGSGSGRVRLPTKRLSQPGGASRSCLSCPRTHLHLACAFFFTFYLLLFASHSLPSPSYTRPRSPSITNRKQRKQETAFILDSNHQLNQEKTKLHRDSTHASSPHFSIRNKESLQLSHMDPRLSPDPSSLDPTPGHTSSTMDTSADNHASMDSDMFTDSQSASVGTPSSLSNVTLTAEGGNNAGGGAEGNSKRKRFVKVVEVDAPNNLDLDAYIATYKGN